MKFVQLAFIVTDACNFRCTYCMQEKESKYMKHATIDKALRFFYPYLDDEAYIVFFGGEPLMAVAAIKHGVALAEEIDRRGQKNLNFSITTNGSLLDEELLDYFDRHRFSMLLSFDGHAQDSGRKTGSYDPVSLQVRRICTGAYPGIEFSTNSVFTPATVHTLFSSLRSIVEAGVPRIKFSIAPNIPWDDGVLETLEHQMTQLTDFLVSYYKRHGSIPMGDYPNPAPAPPSKSKKGLSCFNCVAGRKRMSVSPEEDVWGCAAFHDYLKYRRDSDDFETYSFGRLDDFIKEHDAIYPRVAGNHDPLRQDCFFTGKQSCFLCNAVRDCDVCPVSVAYATSFIGEMPDWTCRLNGIQTQQKQRFLEEIRTVTPIISPVNSAA
ncbi:MAG: radical SAM protein [bacterium]|nr:radical SAM protein [bacterium]